MSLDSLKSAIPDYAKDLKLNLGSVIGNSDLPAQRLWGTAPATAIASRAASCCASWSPRRRPTCRRGYTAAKSAAAIMAMNNVFYRTLHLLSDPEYGTLRAGLRMNVIGNPGVDKVDFELWSHAVSAINGCGQCRTPRAGAPQGRPGPGDHPGSLQDRFRDPGRRCHPDAEAVLAG
ncbi:Alkyl hydroperoxide reductase AhpD OS=Streptomyces fumanus OX=67302 GN=ahpD PE=3 SV=1 [Streptomyces fumanus]